MRTRTRWPEAKVNHVERTCLQDSATAAILFGLFMLLPHRRVAILATGKGLRWLALGPGQSVLQFAALSFLTVPFWAEKSLGKDVPSMCRGGIFAVVQSSPSERVRRFCPGWRVRVSGPLIWLMLACMVSAVAGGEIKAPQSPPSVPWTNAAPLAFAKGNRIRLYFSNESFLFEAKWKQSRVSVQEFNYASTTVERDDSPSPMPSADSDWLPVRMLGAAECERLLHLALERLTPTNAGRGLYVQYSLGDAVLFRDAAGKARLVHFEEKPADVVIERRYGRQAALSEMAQALDADLRAAYPSETRFAAVWSRGQPRILYLDLEHRQSVVLHVPRGGNPDRPKLGKNVKALASFAVVDNAWSFLKNPVSSATRTTHQFIQWTTTLFEPKLRARRSTIPAVTDAPGMDLAEWETWLDRRIGMPRERGAVRLLMNGEKFFPHFERRVIEAQSNLNIHVCIFDRDDIAAGTADLLKARSSNVQVKVIFDRLNSRGAGGTPPATPMRDGFTAPPTIQSYLRNGGRVEVRPQLNPGFTCDHSKVFLIDERFAYIGGMNFGREYRYEWHDLMAEVEGPVVASLQKQFDKKWAQCGLWGDFGLAAEAMRGRGPATPAVEPADAIELRRLYTKTFSRQIRSAQLEAINRARNHILLENAYLYSNDIIIALVRARLRGVDVRVIMPGENDFESGHSSNLVTANYLRQHGVRVFFYPGMSHVKALLVDGWVCFGSANFDALSLRLNRECNLATSDAGFARTFRRDVFEADMAKSREMTSNVQVDFLDHLSDMLLTPL